MKRPIKILLILILASSVLSLIPVADLYLKKDPAIHTNADAIKKLQGNKGDYFAFIVFGDNHAGLIFDDSASLKIIRHINREDRFKKISIDFVGIPGDITFRGSLWDYRAFNKIRSLIEYPVISAMGNHDDDNGGEARFKEYVGEREFSFSNRNSYFIVLDNSTGDLEDEQFAWFESELKKSGPYAHRFVFIHKAPVSLYQRSWYRPELSPWSYRFMKLCEEYKVDIVFSGHEHLFKDGAFGGVKYVITGGGGIITKEPTSPHGFLHYIVVRVYGDYVDYEVRKVFPPFWEFLTYYMWKDAFYFLRDVFF